MIDFQNVSKTFQVAKRSPGLKAAFKALHKREYTNVEALKNVSFHADAGEVVGYIGPNGAGKSTTIKIMSGILVPDCGTCTILGRTPWKQRIEHAKNIGVVFGQRSQLLWDIPVMDSFELLRDIYKVPENEYKKNLNKLIDILDLSPFLDTPVRQLSLGQRMRCEISASLLHSPGILFLDEPTIGLDAVSKLAVRNFIKEINRQDKVTVILTTHDMGDIEALTDRVLLIGKGQILYDGSFEHMKEKYNTSNVLSVNYSSDTAISPIEHTQVISNHHGRLLLNVDVSKTSISSVIHYLSSHMTVIGLTVSSRPIEEIIAGLYKEYAL